MRKRKRRGNYKFTQKKQSVQGMISFGISVISVGVGIGMVVISFQKNGNASVYTGSAGLFSLLLSMLALGIGITGLKEEGKYKLFSVLGTVVSSMALLSWAAIYALGCYAL
ncbi:MAG: DUF6142 family protein [Lachnospiraceae bacterium]